MTILSNINCKLVLRLSCSPIIRMIISLIMIGIMRIWFINIVYAEGIPMEAFESAIYEYDVRHDFIDREAKALAKEAVLNANANYSANQTAVNEKLLQEKSKELASFKYNHIRRAMVYAKKLEEEKVPYNKGLIPQIDLTENLHTESEIRNSLVAPKEKILIKSDSNIEEFLRDTTNEDPVAIKVIFQWYKDAMWWLNEPITVDNCTKKTYTQFIADLGLLLHKEHLSIGDHTTSRFLICTAYYTQDPELYNIAKAYVHLSFLKEDFKLTMTNEVFEKRFVQTIDNIAKTYEYLRKRDANKP